MSLGKLFGFLLAPLGVFIVFLGVGYILKEPPTADLGKERMDLSFLRTIRPSDLNERERKKPKIPPKAEKQPDLPKPKVAKIQNNQNPNPQMQAIPLNMALDVGGGPFVGGVGAAVATGSGDSDMVPIVKVAPQYPREAAMKGIQGYVRLLVDIQQDGSVTNARVVDSNPRRIFDRAAVRAASSYKYRPPIKDGKPVALKNHGIQIDFQIEGM